MRAVQLASEDTLPTLETIAARFNLTPDERIAYLEIESRFYAQDGAPDLIHRLLGWPQPIQGDMSFECQLASHGLYVGDATGYRAPRAAALAPGAADWRLLLQIDSDDAAGMMWGDVGRIYYWLPAAALARRKFSAAWLVLQCC